MILKEAAIIAEVHYSVASEGIQNVTCHLSKDLLIAMCLYLTVSWQQICSFEHFLPELGLSLPKT
jgi:hypothetical protein